MWNGQRLLTSEERQLIGTVLAGGQEGLDALARLLWLSDPGPGGLEELAESEYLAAHPTILEDMHVEEDPKRYQAIARSLWDWLFPAMRANQRSEGGS